MVPTVLDVLGIEPPATIRGVTQSPLQGVSFAKTFDDAAAASDHHTQYFEMLGHRAIYHDGWRAVCPWPGPSFTEAGVGFGQPISADKLSELDATAWELYHVDEDFAENHDVAEANRDKLIALIGTWYVEAGRYGVMPVDGSGLQRMIAEKPQAAAPRDRYTYIPDTQSIPFFAGPRVLNRPHSITATVEIPEGGAEGVLLCQGSAAGGYSLFMKDGALHYVHNYVSPQPAPGLLPRARPGRRARTALRVRADRRAGPRRTGEGAPGRLQLYVDGTLVAEERGPGDHPVRDQPRGAHLRRQPRLAGDAGVHLAVPVHRHAAQRHRRRVRGAHRRQRERDAHGDGPPVAARRPGPLTSVSGVVSTASESIASQPRPGEQTAEHADDKGAGSKEPRRQNSP